MQTNRIMRDTIVATFLLAVTIPCHAAFLDGTTCKIKLTPDPATADKGEKAFDDTVKFADGKFSSAAFLAKGFKPGPYGGEKEEKEAEFEAEQTSDTDGVINWQGQIRGKKVVGRLRWKTKDGTFLAFDFEGATE